MPHLDYLFFFQSLIDGVGLAAVDKTARKCEQAVLAGDWLNATYMWSELQDVVYNVTFGVNWYNILKWNEEATKGTITSTAGGDIFTLLCLKALNLQFRI